MMEAVCFSEALLNLCRATQRHNPNDCNFQSLFSELHIWYDVGNERDVYFT
jgi:hypothetical protein